MKTSLLQDLMISQTSLIFEAALDNFACGTLWFVIGTAFGSSLLHFAFALF
jgi:hypothetical protein